MKANRGLVWSWLKRFWSTSGSNRRDGFGARVEVSSILPSEYWLFCPAKSYTLAVTARPPPASKPLWVTTRACARADNG